MYKSRTPVGVSRLPGKTKTANIGISNGSVDGWGNTVARFLALFRSSGCVIRGELLHIIYVQSSHGMKAHDSRKQKVRLRFAPIRNRPAKLQESPFTPQQHSSSNSRGWQIDRNKSSYQSFVSSLLKRKKREKKLVPYYCSVLNMQSACASCTTYLSLFHGWARHVQKQQDIGFVF